MEGWECVEGMVCEEFRVRANIFHFQKTNKKYFSTLALVLHSHLSRELSKDIHIFQRWKSLPRQRYTSR